MPDVKDYVQRTMDLVSGFAGRGLHLGNEVWCIIGQGKGYGVARGRLVAVTIMAYLDDDDQPGLEVKCYVPGVSRHQPLEDIFWARSQALQAIKEREEQAQVVAAQLAEGDVTKGPLFDVQTCRICGCTDEDCSGCIERTGEPCYWIEEDLCSACAEDDDKEDEGE